MSSSRNKEGMEKSFYIAQRRHMGYHCRRSSVT